MKIYYRYLLAIATLVIFAFASMAAFAESDSKRRYQIESAIVEYKIEGIQTGVQKLQFDRWGARETKSSEINSTIGEVTESIRTFALIDGDIIYSVDFAAKTASKVKNPLLIKELDPKNPIDLRQNEELQMRNLGAKEIGSAVVLGRDCIVFENEKSKIKAYFWKSIPLKMELTMDDLEIRIIATRVEEKPKFSEETFTLPSDVKIIGN